MTLFAQQVSTGIGVFILHPKTEDLFVLEDPECVAVGGVLPSKMAIWLNAKRQIGTFSLLDGM